MPTLRRLSLVLVAALVLFSGLFVIVRAQRPDRPPFDFSWGFAPAQLQRLFELTGASDPDDHFGADTRLLVPGQALKAATLTAGAILWAALTAPAETMRESC